MCLFGWSFTSRFYAAGRGGMRTANHSRRRLCYGYMRGTTMNLPFVIDNQTVKAADVLNRLLSATAGGPVDVASAYFTVSGYAALRENLAGVGALRLLLGKEPADQGALGL